MASNTPRSAMASWVPGSIMDTQAPRSAMASRVPGHGPLTRHGRTSSPLRHGLLSSRIHHGHPSSPIRHGLSSPLTRHGRPSSPLRHGRPSSPLRHGHPSHLTRHGSQNGRRPGGLLSCPVSVSREASRAPTPPPRWMVYGAGRTVREGGVMSGLCSLCLVFPLLSCPYLVSSCSCPRFLILVNYSPALCY